MINLRLLELRQVLEVYGTESALDRSPDDQIM
jgi:hypothetical protein